MRDKGNAVMNHAMKSLGIIGSLIAVSLLARNSHAQTPVLTDPNLEAVNAVTSRESTSDSMTNVVAMAFIASNDILAIQRTDGKVRRILNGQLKSAPVLDLPVANQLEQGALSIRVSPNFATDNLVYIFYVYSGTAGTDVNARGTEMRVSRFTWNGSSLTNEQVIFSKPPKASHHIGGIITFGPPNLPPADQKLFIAIGDNNTLNKAMNWHSAADPDYTSVILRLNQDGTIPTGTDKGPFYDVAGTNPTLQSMYSYGSRNLFGMTFDPVANNLWTTENGEGKYDEVNMVPPGGNGGWLRFMGPSTRPDSINHYGGYPSPSAFVTFGGVGTYYEPAFSWRKPNAVCGLTFIDSDIYGINYKNKLIVTSFLAWSGTDEGGKVFIFAPNSDSNPSSNRKEFVLTGNLADKVHDLPVGSGDTTLPDSDAEVVFGKNFGSTTSAEIGPDGYLYIVGMERSTIYKITPKNSSVDNWGMY